MYYTDTDSFSYSVRQTISIIKLQTVLLRDACDISNVFDYHLTGLLSIANGKEGCYFKNECKSYPIVEFFGIHPNMYLFTVINAE